MTARSSAEAREMSVDLAREDPIHLKRELEGQHSLAAFAKGNSRDSGGIDGLRTEAELALPTRHVLRRVDVYERAFHHLGRAYEYQPDEYEALVELDGIGPGSLRALAPIAELIYDASASREDPAKYAYAHGGKDGTPYPVDRERYDRSVAHVRAVIDGTALARNTKRASFKPLARLEA